MAGGTMEVDRVWTLIEAERRRLAAELAALDTEHWAAPSTCPGWTVRDVAAHVIASPQYGWRDMPGIMARGGFSFHRAILKDGQRRGRASIPDILDQYDRFAATRSAPPTTTPREPLIDVLVHGEDIRRALGRTHEVSGEAALLVIDRALDGAKVFGTQGLRRLRLQATDADWSRGEGPEVSGPIGELLLLVTGRSGMARELAGDGLSLVAG